MIDLKNYIIRQISEYDSDIDTRPGSVYRDVIINPQSALLESYQQDHERLLNRLNITDISELNEDELDAIAANFLIERNTGSLASGSIQLFFSEPTSLTLPANTRFETDGGTVVETINDYTITRLEMQSNVSNFPQYSTADIPARATDTGPKGNIGQGISLTAINNLANTPSRVEVSSEFTGGDSSESNEEFFDRIKNTVFNKTLASPAAIRDRIKDQVSSIVDSRVVGAGHPLMQRDLTDFYDGTGDLIKEDFQYVYPSGQTAQYGKKHRGFMEKFRDTDPSDSLDIPDPTSWETELTPSQYEGLYKKDDVQYTAVDDYAIINEDFEGTEPLQGFNLNDGQHPEQNLFYSDEIRIEGGTLILGNNIQSTSGDSILNLTDGEIQDLIDDLGDGNVENVIENLETIRDPNNFNNLSPVIHQEIDYNAGVRLECNMTTSDSSEEGQMAYITTLRNNEYFAPHDGFGLGWRKQPGFLVRMQNQNHTQEDLDKFEEQYDLDPQNYIGAIKDNPDLWKYNIYLVDNDVLDEEVFIDHQQMVSETSGKNQFLVAGKKWIEPDTNYHFRVKIYETLGVEAWIHETGNAPTEYNESNADLKKGAESPEYISTAGETQTSTLSGGETVNYQRGSFGIGVGETKNHEWQVDDIVVQSFIQSFPMQLFRFHIDSSRWDTSDEFTTSYYGVGYDPELYDQDGSGHSSTKAMIWDPSVSQWEDLGEHQATIDDTREDQLIEGTLTPLSNYMNGENNVLVAATATNTGSDFPDDVNHDLRTYYVSIDNGRTSQVHRGNAIDVYCHDPSNITTGRTTYQIQANTTEIETSSISGFPGHIHSIIEIREAQTGATIAEDDYEVFTADKGEEFSTDGNYKISFTDQNIGGTQIEIGYRYWTEGSSVDSFLTSEDNRYPAIDIKSKTMPPALVTVNQLQFSGGPTAEEAREIVADYFNQLTERSFDKSDIVDLLYDNGANYVNLDIDITIKQYYNNFSYKSFALEGQTYTIPYNNISRFYSTQNLLGGIEVV